MPKQPLVSVIVPAYNHELYVEEALQSVIAQTYKNIELIILNDGSKDNTPFIIKEFIKKNKKYNIKFIDKENEGVCKTLNRGLEIASGEYVAFLASDDLWISEKVSIQIGFMENNKNVGMVFGDSYFLKFNSRTEQKWSQYKSGISHYFKQSLQNENIYKILMKNNIIPALTVMIRKKIFNDVGIFDPNLAYEDYDMWLRIARDYPVGYIDTPVAYYRIHNNNISNNSLVMFKGTFQTVVKHLKNEQSGIFRVFKYFVLFQLASTILINRLKKLLVVKVHKKIEEFK